MVLIEGYTVVIDGSSFDAVYPGGWHAFVSVTPSHLLCADDEIAARAFLTLNQASVFIAECSALGLTEAEVALVVRFGEGVMADADWVELDHAQLKIGPVTVCRLAGSTDERLFNPMEWKYGEFPSRRVVRVQETSMLMLVSSELH